MRTAAPESFAVLGPGGVGGLVAAALARDGAPTTVVAREGTADLIAREGIRVESVLLGDFVARPRAVARLEEPVDVLIVATKATGLGAALERIAGEPGLVVPLLNGLAHLDPLRERFGARAVAGTIRVESDRPERGRVVHTSPFLRVELASGDPAMRRLLAPLAGVLSAAGIPARVESSEAQVLWSKLARLNALACTTTAFDLPLGAIREDPGRRAALEGCVRETVAVASAEGAALDATAVLAELESAHATLTSSMQRDVAAGREPELDAIPGSVLRAAAAHGIPCPAIERMVALIERRLAQSEGA